MEFKKVSKDKIREKFDRSGITRPHYIRPDIQLYKPKEGDNFIRILPPVGEMDDFGLDIWVHSFLGPERGSYLCLERTNLITRKKQKCVLCEFYRKLQGKLEKSSSSNDLMKLVFPKRRTLFWVLDVSDKPQSIDPLVFDAPYRQVAEEIIMRCIDRKTGEIIDISDVKEGREIYFKMTKANRKFPEYRGIELGAVYPIDSKLASKIVPLYSAVVIPDEAELVELVDVLQGFVESGGEEDEEGDADWPFSEGNSGETGSVNKQAPGVDNATDTLMRIKKRLLEEEEA